MHKLQILATTQVWRGVQTDKLIEPEVLLCAQHWWWWKAGASLRGVVEAPGGLEYLWLKHCLQYLPHRTPHLHTALLTHWSHWIESIIKTSFIFTRTQLISDEPIEKQNKYEGTVPQYRGAPPVSCGTRQKFNTLCQNLLPGWSHLTCLPYLQRMFPPTSRSWKASPSREVHKTFHTINTHSFCHPWRPTNVQGNTSQLLTSCSRTLSFSLNQSLLANAQLLVATAEDCVNAIDPFLVVAGLGSMHTWPMITCK